MSQQWGNNGQPGWPAPGANGPGGASPQGGWNQPSHGQGWHQGGGWGQQPFNQPQWGQQQGQGGQWPAAQGQPWPSQQQAGPWGQPQGQWDQQQGQWGQQQGQWGQQQGPWGQPTPPPARRRGGLGRIILLTLGVVLLAIIGLGLVSALSQPQYANEDYKVPEANSAPPEIPVPNDVAEADKWLTANPLYAQKLASPVRCDMPAVDVLTADDATLKKYFEDQMACTMRVWDPAFQSTKTWKLYRPTVTIYSESIQSPCGNVKSVNAFYCGANQQLYYSRLLPRAKQLPTLREPKMVDLVMAHEFGHAIQGRAGLFGGMAAKIILERPPKADQLWLKRRMETQADCLSGMWLRSVAQSRDISEADIRNFYATLEAIGDDRLGAPDGQGDHGVAASRRYWGQLGMSTDEIGKCNTWVAPKEQVR